jgi:nitric oxide reductase NorE protein
MTATRARPEPHVPGEAGIWIFILGDMLVFALFFCVFTFYRGEQQALFSASQASLNTGLGLANTLLLLTSSWFVIEAVQAARQGLRKLSCGLFFLTFLCGVAFCGIKLVEYSEKIAAGITLTSNDFFMFYYIFTGLHFVHVIIGLVMLVFVMLTLARQATGEQELRFVEVGASYWHMVDVLWIILFPLIYLVK